MSSKEKPTLAGQRIRSRKRDEKVRHEPEAFRAEVVKGLNEAEGDLEKAAKFLDLNGDNLDYRRYAEQLFDILIAGGTLAPGGTVDDGPISAICVFASELNDDAVKAYANLFNLVVRRFKYLQVSLEEEVTKVLKFLKSFDEVNRQKLALLTCYLLGNQLITAKPFQSLLNDTLTKENLSAEFMADLLKASVRDGTFQSVCSILKKDKYEQLVQFFPSTRATFEHLREFFKAKGGLEEAIAWQSTQQTSGVKREIQRNLSELLSADADQENIIHTILSIQQEKGSLPEADLISLIFSSLMDAIEWNKKADLVAEQAVRHLNANVKLLATFCKADTSQVALLVRMQNYCYDNQSFVKIFQKLVLLLYKKDVISEEAVLEWYHRAHSVKGKSVFLEQMTKMIEWLQSAEEESSGEEEGED